MWVLGFKEHMLVSCRNSLLMLFVFGQVNGTLVTHSNHLEVVKLIRCEYALIIYILSLLYHICCVVCDLQGSLRRYY